MILYLGNNLKSKSVTETTMVVLSRFLITEGYTVKLASSRKNKLFRLLSMLNAIVKYRKKIDYVLIDTYSTQNFFYAYLSSQLCRVLNLKYIPILHGGNLPERLKRSPRRSHALFANSHKNVAPSNYLKSVFTDHGFKVEYIPNILEIDNYKFLQRGVSTPKLLYVRAFANIYNPTMAIRTLNEIKKDYPDAMLCMIGPVKDRSYNECLDLTSELGLTDQVEFTGKLSKSEWHKKSEDYNIFINTTRVDNMPVSILEAMALGLPVVSTNVGGLPYIISDRKNGLLVKGNDEVEMAAAVTLLCEDQELVADITNTARKEVERYDWEYVKKNWKEILQ